VDVLDVSDTPKEKELAEFRLIISKLTYKFHRWKVESLDLPWIKEFGYMLEKTVDEVIDMINEFKKINWIDDEEAEDDTNYEISWICQALF